jgi:competence protein ComEA
MRQAAYVILGVLGGFLLAGVLFLLARPSSGQAVVLQDPPTQAPLQVHVVGAVLRPGVYIFAEGSRVQDAITAAGGLTSEANVDTMNLAAKLEDGQQLVVPSGGVAAAGEPQPTAGFRVLPSSNPTATPSGDLININTASAEILASLPGIGPTTAQRIVDYRTENGPFATIDDLLNVAGIGPATFDNIHTLITAR